MRLFPVSFPAFSLIVLVATVSVANSATVTNTNDSGTGSLREAISVTPAGGTVNFALSGCPCTIALTTGTLIVNKDLTIAGPGANMLTISGNNTSRVFYVGDLVADAVTVIFEGIKISNGNANFGGGIHSGGHLTVRDSVVTDNTGEGISSGGSLAVINSKVSNNSGGVGGGIRFQPAGDVGTFPVLLLSVLNSEISNNFASDVGGGMYILCALEKSAPVGCGPQTGGSAVTITNSSITGNRCPHVGAGIYVQDSTVNITNSTISGNIDIAKVRFGLPVGIGIINIDRSTLTITDSTITKNVALVVLPPDVDQSGSGIYNSGEIFAGERRPKTILRNSIVAGNLPGHGDIAHREPAEFVSLGYNLIGNGGSLVKVFNQPGDQAGVPESPIDPRLEPLAFNGGPTRTHALRLNSSAVDRGKSFGLATDQRGLERPNDNPDLTNAALGDGSDIGAIEIQFPVAGAVSVTGRVGFSGGVAQNRGFVTLTSISQGVRYAPVNPFGYYRFTNVPLGRGFSVGLMSKGWFIQPQMIFIAEPVSNFDLTATRSP